jgi:hypothetical protein
MAEVTGLGVELFGFYQDFLSTLPPFAANFFNFLILVLLVVIYSVFIWKFYKFIARKNILQLDLNKYNRSSHPFFAKVIAGLLYFAEYIIILPFLIFFWFSIFTILLIFLTENLDISTLLVVSATIIAAIRMTSYYKEGLAKDLAKLLPFTLLAISITNPNFFNIERIFTHFSQIPGFFGNIAYYLFFIIILEVILRFFDFIFSLFGIEEVQEEEEIKK